MEASYGDDLLVEKRPGNIFLITMKRPPENRLTVKYCQKMRKVYHDIQTELGGNREGGPDSDGAVILRGSDFKYFTTVRIVGLARQYRYTENNRVWTSTSAITRHLRVLMGSIPCCIRSWIFHIRLLP